MATLEQIIKDLQEIADGGGSGRGGGRSASERKAAGESKKILEFIKKEWTLRQIAKQLDVSTKTVQKVKRIGSELNLLTNE